MKNKKQLILWIFIALVGISLVLFSKKPGLILNGSSPSPEPNLSSSPSPTGQSSVTEEPFLGMGGLKSPATCQISGTATFSSSNSFISDTKIAWQNIDSQGRLINWKISPADDLAIGPNIFGNLSVPNGEYNNLTIRLPQNPKSKNYTALASVTYGQIINGNVEVKETNCSGQVKINLNY